MAGIRFMNAEGRAKMRSVAPVTFSEAGMALEAPDSSVARKSSGLSNPKGGVDWVRPNSSPGRSSSAGSVRFVAEDQGGQSRQKGSMSYSNKYEGMVRVAGRGDGDEDDETMSIETRRRLRQVLNEDQGPAVTFSGTGGPARARGQVVGSKKSWDDLWKSVGGHDMPDLDFTRQMGIVIFAGDQPPGSSVQILSAEPKNGKYVVVYEILRPRRRLAGPNTRPYQVRVAPKSALSVVFKQAK